MTEASREGRTRHAAILHVDMDAFFVSVELLERPDLVGKPVAVGGSSDRSIISSASYEARARGVHSAMSVVKAKQLCPELVLLPVGMSNYSAMSRRVMEVFTEFTPLVEPLSIDEAFLDVTGAQRLLGTPREIAFAIRQRILDQLGLPCSVGIASTKFVAKLASQRAKPNGVLEIEPEHTLEFLHALPISAMWGVGRVTEEKLAGRGIETVGELAAYPVDKLKRAVGEASAHRLHQLANGHDVRSVETDRVTKSVGNEVTFDRDLVDPTPLLRELLFLSHKVSARLRAKGVKGRTVALKVKFADFSIITRSHTLVEPTDSSQRIYETVTELFEQAELKGRPVRLIGVRLEHLVDVDSVDAALWIDEDDSQWQAIDKASDALRSKFGKNAVTPARLIEPHE